jgi:hypothetical protein
VLAVVVFLLVPAYLVVPEIPDAPAPEYGVAYIS